MTESEPLTPHEQYRPATLATWLRDHPAELTWMHLQESGPFFQSGGEKPGQIWAGSSEALLSRDSSDKAAFTRSRSRSAILATPLVVYAETMLPNPSGRQR